ncbi:DPH1 [Hepatospora eriocheir]|uniref:2-(3-amino-3-carboxypropyl)histidine synthase subunit 1 n=1 Tax=Hepatospora eriocheir TaxID=1081669 RepID=A0A1X0QJT0_9MICR|nr:DPH1 [Hepatospora eriocheir]
MIKLIKKEDKWSDMKNVDGLPLNYNFEIPKTLRIIEKNLQNKEDVLRISLQFPDGLLTYAPVLINLFYFTFKDKINVTILNDVVYGACCIDDAFPSDLIIHYGHSCLVPVTEMNCKVLYVFVDIKIDIQHLYELIVSNFSDKNIALLGTIQFNSAVNRLCHKFKTSQNNNVNIPRVRPLSNGEVLGCTSPVIKEDIVVYIGDGRFHLESAMIRNPQKEFYKYSPYDRKLTKEFYDFDKMINLRNEASTVLKKLKYENITFGVILSNLGKQANQYLFERVVKKLKSFNIKVYKIVCGEINNEILKIYSFCDGFVQIGCPRLSIDWGCGYIKPLLSPYEIFRYLDDHKGAYMMDYYSKEEKNPWSMYGE